MPVADLVVDTNVLMHASNPTEARFADCVAFLERLIESTTALCVDEGFSVVEADNRSLIGTEYLTHLVHGAMGHSVVTHLAQTGRVVERSTRLAVAGARKLNQLISNKRDRTFVRVAANSTDRTFVSHDFRDFPKKKRATVKKELAVTVLTAAEARGSLA